MDSNLNTQIQLDINERVIGETVFRTIWWLDDLQHYSISKQGAVHNSKTGYTKNTPPKFLHSDHPSVTRMIHTHVAQAKLWLPIPQSCLEYTLDNLCVATKDSRDRTVLDNMVWVPVKTWVKAPKLRSIGEIQIAGEWTLLQLMHGTHLTGFTFAEALEKQKLLDKQRQLTLLGQYKTVWQYV